MPQGQASGVGRRNSKAAVVTSVETACPTAYDEAQAHREGWTVARRGPREDGSEWVEVRRVGAEGCRFVDDESARHYVVAQARAGSDLHRAALDLCDTLERELLRVFCGDWQATNGEEPP
jgi:hypothetical protein